MSKHKTVKDLIDMVKNADLSHRELNAHHDRETKVSYCGDDHLKGPLFSFLVGAGFSASANYDPGDSNARLVPGTGHIVEALKCYEDFRDEECRAWLDVLHETKSFNSGGSRLPSYEVTREYFRLMNDVLDSPVARQRFIAAVVEYSSMRSSVPNWENLFLAALLTSSVSERFYYFNEEESDLSWLPKVFASHVFTTNFDDLIPRTFYLLNQP